MLKLNSLSREYLQNYDLEPFFNDYLNRVTLHNLIYILAAFEKEVPNAIMALFAFSSESFSVFHSILWSHHSNYKYINNFIQSI